jgi:hypothetical protein
MLVKRCLAAALFLTVAFVAAAGAQGTTRCMINGRVVDADRAPVVGVSIEAASGVAGDQPRALTSDADGAFRFEDLPSGTYTVTVTKPEYVTFKREGLVLRPGMNMSMTVVLRPDRIRD